MEVETIIVGSGVAAAALARGLLAADPQHSLLVLEAGPKVPVKDRRMWWDYVVNNVSPYEQCHDLPLANPKSPGDPFENQLIHGDEQPDGTREKTEWGFRESRMMGYGGSTYHWGGWGLRFKPEDFKLY
ncbi:MAG TPA: lycopene cyclase family protein, partial [Pirellulales bacterium]